MNNADKARAAAIEEVRKDAEPGFGTGLLAVLVIVSVTAIISVIIYALMLAIRPIDARQPKSGSTDYLQVLAQNAARAGDSAHFGVLPAYNA